MANRKPLRLSINMAMSADGKISSHRRESVSLGSAEDRYLMDVLRAKADAVIVGSRTVRLDGWAIRVRDTKLRDARRKRTKEPHPLNVILSTRLDLPTTSQFFTHSKTRKLIITTREATERRVRKFKKFGEVIVQRRKRIDLHQVMNALSDRGVKRVLGEGGGHLNYSFFAAGLIDELFITITPRILGGGDAPTVVDGKGFPWDAHTRLALVSVRRRGDEVFLRYKTTT